MEKIDLTKCNNCRYKAKIDGIVTTGIVSAKDGINAFLKNEQGYNVGYLTGAGLVDSDNRPITDFEIVPRDPETYQDWQVGDIACAEKHRNTRYEVIFRSGELVFFKDWNNNATTSFTCSEAFRRFGFRLVLTDIEKQIIEERKDYKPQDGDIIAWASTINPEKCAISIYKDYECSYASLFTTGTCRLVSEDLDIKFIRPATDAERQQLFDAMAKKGKRWNAEKKVVEDIPDLRAVKSEIKSEIKSGHQFKKGEPVLVKDYDDNIWKLAAFRQRSGNASYPYEVRDERGNHCNHRKCIPYNEKTMHLLGTTEDYKEEQS